MLSIYDAQAGAVAEVRPGRRRELRLQVSAPAAGGGIGLADLQAQFAAAARPDLGNGPLG